MRDNWKRNLRVGVDFMDHEHEGLALSLAEVEAAIEAFLADPDSLTKLSLSLERFWIEVTNHFAHEEQVMRHHQYPFLPSHAAVHARFLERLEHLRRRCGEPDGEPPSHWTVRHLQQWFTRHTRTHDTQFAHWLTTTRPEAAHTS